MTPDQALHAIRDRRALHTALFPNPKSAAATHKRLLKELLGVPIRIESRGPTAADEQWKEPQ